MTSGIYARTAKAQADAVLQDGVSPAMAHQFGSAEDGAKPEAMFGLLFLILGNCAHCPKQLPPPSGKPPSYAPVDPDADGDGVEDEPEPGWRNW